MPEPASLDRLLFELPAGLHSEAAREAFSGAILAAQTHLADLALQSAILSLEAIFASRPPLRSFSFAIHETPLGHSALWVWSNRGFLDELDRPSPPAFETPLVEPDSDADEGHRSADRALGRALLAWAQSLPRALRDRLSEAVFERPAPGFWLLEALMRQALPAPSFSRWQAAALSEALPPGSGKSDGKKAAL